jgi:CRISPR-associated protein Cas2
VEVTVLVLVSYDVSTTSSAGRRRLRQVAKACKDFGVRVQYSVFECSLGDKEWVLLRARLLDILEPAEDSLRVYHICESDVAKTEHHGVREPLDPDGVLIA